uniref:Uncharacterized protein n=1 Tax=Ixodes ricinus TaxID=34613 RepID=A0A6B0UTE0_IXORI
MFHLTLCRVSASKMPVSTVAVASFSGATLGVVPPLVPDVVTLRSFLAPPPKSMPQVCLVIRCPTRRNSTWQSHEASAWISWLRNTATKDSHSSVWSRGPSSSLSRAIRARNDCTPGHLLGRVVGVRGSSLLLSRGRRWA